MNGGNDAYWETVVTFKMIELKIAGTENIAGNMVIVLSLLSSAFDTPSELK